MIDRPMPKPASASMTARHVAAAAIARACPYFPDIGPVALDTEALSPADRALATAIHRTTLQRWLTLEHLLNRVSKQPMAKMEPAMRAVLLTGAAQLLFMPGVAPYAVVDESVKIAARLVRPQARAMVNAVLRKVSTMPARIENDQVWTPGRDRLPLDTGTLYLQSPALPHPDNLVKHLTAATSHPEALVNRWMKLHGGEETTRLCLHSIQTPPTIVVTEAAPFESHGAQPPDYPLPATSPLWIPHTQPGLIVWTADHESLRSFLAEDPRRRRVQDPSSLASGQAAAGLDPKVILDYCAGLGTKTRQLATMYPDAQIVATDVNDKRREVLAELPAIYPNVQVVEPEQAVRQRCDLLLLDVPCSNSGVLARRPEARYRLTPQTLGELVALQRQIIEQTLPAAAGHILYTTCSIEPEENQHQGAWLIERTGGTRIREHAIMPSGTGVSYHDGSYHLLLSLL